MERKSFTFFKSYYEALSELPDDIRLELYDAICAYALTGEEPNLDGYLGCALWKLIEPTLTKGIKISEGGKKGGETKKQASSNRLKKEKQASSDTLETKKQASSNRLKKEKQASSDTLETKNQREKEYEYEEEKEYEYEEEKEYEYEEEKEIEEVVSAYNEFCPSLPKCTKLTDQRKKHIRARLKMNSIEDIKMVFLKAEASDFLSGRKGGWQADLNWLVKSEDNMTKVLEGNYDNKSQEVSRKMSEDESFSYSQFVGGD